jgi:hypothetical protein
MTGQPGQLGQNSPAMAGSCRCPWRRRSGAEKEGGRGPLGPLAHQGHSGVVSLPRDGPAATNLAAASSVSGEGIGDSGGDWRREASILSARRERMARRTFSAHRGGKGRSLAVMGGDGHGGKLGLLGGFTGEREERARERR